MHIEDFTDCLHQLLDVYAEEAQEDIPDGIYKWTMTLKVKGKVGEVDLLNADIQDMIKVVK